MAYFPTEGATQSFALVSEAERDTWASHRDMILTHLAPVQRVMPWQSPRLSDQPMKETRCQVLGPWNEVSALYGPRSVASAFTHKHPFHPSLCSHCGQHSTCTPASQVHLPSSYWTFRLGYLVQSLGCSSWAADEVLPLLKSMAALPLVSMGS